MTQLKRAMERNRFIFKVTEDLFATEEIQCGVEKISSDEKGGRDVEGDFVIVSRAVMTRLRNSSRVILERYRLKNYQA